MKVQGTMLEVLTYFTLPFRKIEITHCYLSSVKLTGPLLQILVCVYMLHIFKYTKKSKYAYLNGVVQSPKLSMPVLLKLNSEMLNMTYHTRYHTLPRYPKPFLW